ncbi:hypothetical protein ACJMK2_035541 [Sinanodonta woodiana]|uniref:Uncharacterized protein n=1 Tax=Sinanodonta woodiana TaxID=1069815 RepID=A0ABD3WYS1_SINWO
MYRDTLDVTSKQRYGDKIGLIEKQDPYTLEKHRWTQDVDNIKETFQQPFIPKVLNNKFPKLLSELFNDELIDASFSEILAYCKNVNVSVSKEE